MDRVKRLAALVDVRDELREDLRSAIKEDKVSPESRSEVLTRLESIQREIEALRK